MLNATLPKIGRDFINGLVLGISQIIPGVSGGTIALILGVYFELIEAINNFARDIRKNLLLFIPLFIGMAAGLIIFSSIVNFLLRNFSFPTMLFFIGLIAGIVPHVYAKAREGEKFIPRDILFIAAPFIILLVISFLKGDETGPRSPEELIANIGLAQILLFFFGGVLAAAALIVPGFSGSFVLLLLGLYHPAIYSISTIRILLTDITNIALLLDICKVLVPLGIGIIIGFLSMARIIEKLLRNYQKQVYQIILGLILGSIIALFNEPMVYSSGVSPNLIIIGIASFVLGTLVSYFIGRKRL